MQRTLAESEGASGARADLPARTSPVTKPTHHPVAHARRRLYFSLGQGVLTCTLMSLLFTYGVHTIRQNARALGLFVLSFNDPKPFWWIGLWGLSISLLALLFIIILRNICIQLAQLLRPTA